MPSTSGFLPSSLQLHDDLLSSAAKCASTSSANLVPPWSCPIQFSEAHDHHLRRGQNEISSRIKRTRFSSFLHSASTSSPPEVEEVLKIKNASTSGPFSFPFLRNGPSRNKRAKKGHPTAFGLVQLVQHYFFPVTRSNAVLKETQLCPTAACRNQVALLGGGEDGVKFVIDAAGVKWKCGGKDMLHGEMRGTDGWACIELDCRKTPHGVLDHTFHGRNDCGEPLTITNVDGLEAEGAPKSWKEYELVEEAMEGSCVEQ